MTELFRRHIAGREYTFQTPTGARMTGARIDAAAATITLGGEVTIDRLADVISHCESLEVPAAKLSPVDLHPVPLVTGPEKPFR